jgi:hypothetical protein
VYHDVPSFLRADGSSAGPVLLGYGWIFLRHSDCPERAPVRPAQGVALSGGPSITWVFVILSEAKNLRRSDEILRFAQDDSLKTPKLYLDTRLTSETVIDNVCIYAHIEGQPLNW